MGVSSRYTDCRPVDQPFDFPLADQVHHPGIGLGAQAVRRFLRHTGAAATSLAATACANDQSAQEVHTCGLIHIDPRADHGRTDDQAAVTHGHGMALRRGVDRPVEDITGLVLRSLGRVLRLGRWSNHLGHTAQNHGSAH